MACLWSSFANTEENVVVSEQGTTCSQKSEMLVSLKLIIFTRAGAEEPSPRLSPHTAVGSIRTEPTSLQP